MQPFRRYLKSRLISAVRPVSARDVIDSSPSLMNIHGQATCALRQEIHIYRVSMYPDIVCLSAKTSEIIIDDYKLIKLYE